MSKVMKALLISVFVKGSSEQFTLVDHENGYKPLTGPEGNREKLIRLFEKVYNATIFHVKVKSSGEIRPYIFYVEDKQKDEFGNIMISLYANALVPEIDKKYNSRIVISYLREN